MKQSILKLTLIALSTFATLSSELMDGAPSATAPLQDFTKVAETAIPAVVSIRTKVKVSRQQSFSFFDPFEDDFLQRFFGMPKERKSEERELRQPSVQGQGSGFIVSKDGYIMTNSHVVKGADEIEVLLNDGRQFKAELIGHDPNTDVAICKIPADSLPYLTLGNSSELKVGQWAIAVGNPLGLEASLTVGVVSAKGRNNLRIAAFEDFIQTDAAINRGNSGGPLLNIAGEVVGMNTAIASNTGGYMGIGFAIPIDMAKNVMQQLIQRGSVVRGFLGIVLQPIDQDLARALGLQKIEGALVAEVQEGSPAAKAGIQQGDVILSLNGQPIESAAQLRNQISLMAPKTSVTLTLLRDHKEKSLRLEIGSHPENAKEGEKESNLSLLGIQVKDLSREAAAALNLGPAQGVVISEIDPNGIAAEAGLKKGMIILEVNQTKVTSATQLQELLNKANRGAPLLLLIRQDSVNRFVAIYLR